MGARLRGGAVAVRAACLLWGSRRNPIPVSAWSTSPPKPASLSNTTTAHSAANICPRLSAPAWPFSTTTRTAGRTFCSSTEPTGRGTAAAHDHGALPQQPRRHIHRRHPARGPRCRDVRDGRSCRRFQQRRISGSVYYGRRTEPLIPKQRAAADLPTSPREREGHLADTPVSARPRSGSTTTATGIWTCSSPIT